VDYKVRHRGPTPRHRSQSPRPGSSPASPRCCSVWSTMGLLQENIIEAGAWQGPRLAPDSLEPAPAAAPAVRNGRPAAGFSKGRGNSRNRSPVRETLTLANSGPPNATAPTQFENHRRLSRPSRLPAIVLAASKLRATTCSFPNGRRALAHLADHVRGYKKAGAEKKTFGIHRARKPCRSSKLIPRRTDLLVPPFRPWRVGDHPRRTFLEHLPDRPARSW